MTGLAFGLSLVSLLCLLGVTLLTRRRVELAYRRGLADAGARLVGIAANELGYEHPALDRMAQALGELSRR